MGIAWRSNGDGTASGLECDPFAEVIYEDNSVLVVNVDTSAMGDGRLTDALMDAITANDQRRETESAIELVAEAHGMVVHPTDARDQRALTIAPSVTAARPDV